MITTTIIIIIIIIILIIIININNNYSTNHTFLWLSVFQKNYSLFYHKLVKNSQGSFKEVSSLVDSATYILIYSLNCPDCNPQKDEFCHFFDRNLNTCRPTITRDGSIAVALVGCNPL